MKCTAFAPIGLLAAGIVAVVGCVPIPIPNIDPPIVHGDRVAGEANRAAVVPGQSREEVIQRLGVPDYNLGAGRAFVYPWTRDKGSVLGVAPSGYVLGPWRWAEARVFIVVFGDDGRSMKTGTAAVPMFRSVSGVVRNWMKEHDLPVLTYPQPGDSSSTIVIYRRMDPPCSLAQRTIDPWSPFQSPFAPTVKVDEQVVGDLQRGEFLQWATAAGTHLVVVEGVPPFRRFEAEGMQSSKSEAASLAVKVEPGQTIYAEAWTCCQAYQTGPRCLTYLEFRDAEQARAGVSSLKSAWP